MLRKSDVATLGNGKVLYLRGTPYEQGRQLGVGAADLIAEGDYVVIRESKKRPKGWKPAVAPQGKKKAAAAKK